MLYGLGAVGLWSTVATAFKWALASMRPIELMSVAALVSWLFITALMVRRGELATALRRGWRTALWAGLMNPVVYYLVLFAAYDRLPGQEAMAINYTWALTMALLAVPLLKQRLTPLDLGAGLISYAGVWTIATRGDVFAVHFADPLGVALALFSTLLWALYWLLNRRDERAPLVAQWQNFTVALPVLWGLMAWQTGLQWHGWASLGAGVYVGLCEMGIAFVLWQQAMHHVSRTAKISNLIFLAPPVSLLLLHVVLGEPILASTLLGLVLILGGLGLQQLQKTPQGTAVAEH